ncbi:MAG: hypothetical protein ACT4OK_14585 [Gemmobacter sp.]
MRLFCLAAMALPTFAVADDLSVRLGAAQLVGDAPRVLMPVGTTVQAGDVATMIFADPVTGDVRISQTTLGDALPRSDDLAEDRTAFAVPATDAPAIGFAVIGAMPGIEVTDGKLRLDVTGDGVAETLTTCLTTEAVQLRATDDAGTDVWSEYLPLGYDVEPTCP